MAKTKTPLFSLGSQGSIGNVLTTQKRPGTTMVRAKPTPAYRRTLPQQYQRWLYEDYAYLWTQQSAVTRGNYRAAGSRFHLTGYQYWMKYQLTNLPDIMAWYRVDESPGATTPDNSRNLSPATIFGATSTPGLISRAFHFDGLNDKLQAPHIPAYTATAALSIECFFYLHALNINQFLVAKFRAPPNIMYFLFQITPTNFLRLYIGGAAVGNTANSINPVLQDTWYHALGLFDGTNTRLFLDAIPQINAITPIAPVVTTEPLDIACYNGNDRWLSGVLDNLIIRNRAPDTTEIKRWAERRYP